MNVRRNNDKISGYIILIVGLGVMIFSIAWMAYVFLGGRVPVNIFSSNGASQAGSTGSPVDVLQPLLPMFNVLVWFSMGFIILAAGGRVAMLGIKMMKASLPDVVALKDYHLPDAPKAEAEDAKKV